MSTTRETTTDKICYVCGDYGFADCLVTCCHCNTISEHIYCMYAPMLQIPAIWYCKECLSSARANEVFAAVIFAAALISSSGRRRN